MHLTYFVEKYFRFAVLTQWLILLKDLNNFARFSLKLNYMNLLQVQSNEESGSGKWQYSPMTYSKQSVLYSNEENIIIQLAIMNRIDKFLKGHLGITEGLLPFSRRSAI